MTNNNILIRRYIIVGERRLSNYWWAIVIFLGSCGFLFTGISSYFGTLGISLWGFMGNQPPMVGLPISPNTLNPDDIVNNVLPFFPQGLLMSFYGSLGFLLTIYWGLLIFWNVGGGFNEFNKKEGFVRIFRWGYPGKNRKIDLSYKISEVEAIRVELKQGLDPQRTIYLCLKGVPQRSSPFVPVLAKQPEDASLSNLSPSGIRLERSSPLPPSSAKQPQRGMDGVQGTVRGNEGGKGSVQDGGRATNKAKREIPLTGIGQPLTLKEIEKQASELANFLQVSLEA